MLKPAYLKALCGLVVHAASLAMFWFGYTGLGSAFICIAMALYTYFAITEL